MYDFILFENYHLAVNHYKDLCLIAKMLVASGYKVAIADVFDEENNCKIEGVPHITINAIRPNINRKISKNRIVAFLQQYYFVLAVRSYLAKAIKELLPLCNSLYAGSYHVNLSLGMIKAVPTEKNIFFWGLRSYRLYEYKLHKDFFSWNCRKVSKYVYHHDNVKFFVSDSMIKSEFINIGIQEDRLVIRPERVIFQLQPIIKPSSRANLHLLSIGSIRPEKRVEKILEAVREFPNESFFYTIAGKTDEAYEQIIQQSMIGMQNVQRLNYRLSEKEYYELIDNCDFLVLCDIKMPANVTNGTLSEALLQLKPVIAPNYDPYKTIIEQNKVGILYDPDDASSLKLAMKKAFENKSTFYYESLVKYQRSFLFSSVVEQFHKDMELCLKN